MLLNLYLFSNVEKVIKIAIPVKYNSIVKTAIAPLTHQGIKILPGLPPRQIFKKIWKFDKRLKYI